nr:putative membrane protein [Rhodococcus sp. JVH1]
MVAIAEAGFLAVWVATAGQSSTAITDVLIVLFSLAMGIQTAAVRSLGVQGVFTTAGTFTLVAFAETLAGSRPRSEIPRLVGVLVRLVAGAIGGGLLVVHVRSYAPLLPLVITVLVIVAGRTMQAPSRRSARRAEHRRQERVVLAQSRRDPS